MNKLIKTKYEFALALKEAGYPHLTARQTLLVERTIAANEQRAQLQVAK